MPLSIIDILFLVTVAMLVFNGLRNGLIFSLINLVSIPLGLGIAYAFGPQFTAFLAANGLPATPLIAYVALFFGTVLVLHIVGTAVRGVAKNIPLLGGVDSLLGGAVGFVEAWLLWLTLLIVLGNFLGGLQNTIQQGSHIIPGLNIHIAQLQAWHDFYNQTVTDSIFARVNGFFVKALPNLPQLPQ